MYQVRNPIWIDQQQGILDCELMIDDTWVPFTANSQDTKVLGPEIVRCAQQGMYGQVPQRPAANTPLFDVFLSVDKSKFIYTLTTMNLISQHTALQCAQTNSLPPDWVSALSNATPEHVLAAQISFASDQKISEYTDWVHILTAYGVIDKAVVKSALLASI